MSRVFFARGVEFRIVVGAAARGDFPRTISSFASSSRGIVDENPIQRRHEAGAIPPSQKPPPPPPPPAKYVIRETRLKTATPCAGTAVSRKLAFSPSIAFLRPPLYGFNAPTLAEAPLRLLLTPSCNLTARALRARPSRGGDRESSSASSNDARATVLFANRRGRLCDPDNGDPATDLSTDSRIPANNRIVIDA